MNTKEIFRQFRLGGEIPFLQDSITPPKANFAVENATATDDWLMKRKQNYAVLRGIWFMSRETSTSSW
jgi:hypothetical protein